MPFANCENHQHASKINKKDSQNRFTSGFSIFRLTNFGVYSLHVTAHSNLPSHYRRTSSEKGKKTMVLLKPKVSSASALTFCQ